MSEKMEAVINGLNKKAVLKQDVYAKTSEVFALLKECAINVQNTLAPNILKNHGTVEVLMNDYGDFEFDLKFSGDTIVFIMHTNVFAFPPNHYVSKSPYVKLQPDLGYFGMIQIYNFLSDSLKYNRMGDAGYQLARIFVNVDGHFYTEGKRKLGFLYNDVSKQQVSVEHLHNIIEQCMIYCLDFDLYVPPTETFEVITVQQKNYFNNPSGITTGKRLGFKVVDQTKLH